SSARLLWLSSRSWSTRPAIDASVCSNSCSCRSMTWRSISRVISSRNSPLLPVVRIAQSFFRHRDSVIKPVGRRRGKRKRMVWAHQDLNLGPAGYEPAALNLAELWALAHASDETRSYQLWPPVLRDRTNRFDSVAFPSQSLRCSSRLTAISD